MLRIRLRKPGKSIKRRYHFKIVVSEARKARESDFVEEVGFYDPSKDLLKIDIEKYQEWIRKGAKPTETVKSLFKRYKKISK
ncbi:MAG: 30S ribosomal protein S16 [Candidatus Omnitrophica bacterium 4484_70.1]|nr:MAG: 30S ribosomal protein S16 [Candidatus Omnitrophica bacterium 4484_70.1]